jgi:hypothetical protein
MITISTSDSKSSTVILFVFPRIVVVFNLYHTGIKDLNSPTVGPLGRFKQGEGGCNVFTVPLKP